MTEDDIRKIVRSAVRETLIEIGVDASAPGAIIAIQQDFAFLRRQRQVSEQIGVAVRRGLVGTLIVGIAAALWVGFKWQVTY
jgi:hypothetical protein